MFNPPRYIFSIIIYQENSDLKLALTNPIQCVDTY